MLPREYATGSPHFAKAAEVKKIIFKSELYLQVSRNWEQLLGTAPGSRRGQGQPGERGDGRAAGGAGRGGGSSTLEKAGARGRQRGTAPGVPPRRRQVGQTSPAGRCGPSASGQETKALLQGTHRAICCCCWVAFVNLLANSASITARSFPPLASLPGGSIPASRCAFQVTQQSTFCGKDCACCCPSVHLVELPGRLRWAKSFKISTKCSEERKTQQTRPRV